MKMFFALALAAPLLLVAPRARGQATPPSPTPAPAVTATPVALPPGPDLLDKADAADLAKDTAHAQGLRQEIKPGKLKTVEREQSDAAWHEQQFHVVITSRQTRLSAHPPTAGISRIEWIVVGNRSATRLDQGRWSCGTSTSVSADANNGAPNTPKPVTQDAEMLHGVPVWRVRRTAMHSAHGTVTRETIDDYISQLDYTWIREISSTTVSAHGTITDRVKERVDFSRYGEAVHVQLPAACRQSMGKEAALATAVPGLLVRPLGDVGEQR
jgi:hypothetical protein